MGKASGEQSRRSYVAAQKRAEQQYARMMEMRDGRRLVCALRSMAKRIEDGLNRAGRPAAPGWTGGIAVTDHAVLRFLERAMGLNVPAIRREIARAVPASALPTLESGPGSHGIYQRDGLQFLVTPSSVVSVLTDRMDGSGWLEIEELELVEAAQCP